MNDPASRPLSGNKSRAGQPSPRSHTHGPTHGPGAGAARAHTAVPGSRAAPIKVPGPGAPLVTNVFGRGLGANGTHVYGLEQGNLRNLAVELDEQKRRQDRRERELDEREARLIGNEAIEAMRLSHSLAQEAGLGGRMTYSPTGVMSGTGGRGRGRAGGYGYDYHDEYEYENDHRSDGGGGGSGGWGTTRPSTAPQAAGAGAGAGGEDDDGGSLFVSPRRTNGMFGGMGSTRGGNVPSRGILAAGGRGVYNPGSRHALMPDIPISGKGINSDQIGAAAGGESGTARAEMRHLRSIIAELEPKLRDALKEAQMANRRERTAQTQLEDFKASMEKKHAKVVEELTAAAAAAEARALEFADESRQLQDELHKSERVESTLRVELNALKEQFPGLVQGKERFEKLAAEHKKLNGVVERMKKEASDALDEMERLRGVARLAEQSREEAKVDAEEANRLLTSQMEQLHQAEKGVELLSRTNRLLEEQLDVFMRSDPKSQWQGAMKSAKKQEKANDERRLYERIIDMERRRSETALAELALLHARVKGYENKIQHCRAVLAEQGKELERAEGTIESQRDAAHDASLDFESRDQLRAAELQNMRARQRRLVQQLRLALAIAEHHQTRRGGYAPLDDAGPYPARGEGRLVGPPPPPPPVPAHATGMGMTGHRAEGGGGGGGGGGRVGAAEMSATTATDEDGTITAEASSGTNNSNSDVYYQQAAAIRRRSMGGDSAAATAQEGGDDLDLKHVGGGGGASHRGRDGVSVERRTIGDEEAFVAAADDDDEEEEDEEFADFGGEITMRPPPGEGVEDEGDGSGGGGEGDAESSHSTVSEFQATGRVKGMTTEMVEDPDMMRPLSPPEATLRMKDVERIAAGEAPYY